METKDYIKIERMFTKSHFIGWLIALVFAMLFVYQQTQTQAAEFKAHVAQELLEKSQDAIVNAEVSK